MFKSLKSFAHLTLLSGGLFLYSSQEKPEGLECLQAPAKNTDLDSACKMFYSQRGQIFELGANAENATLFFKQLHEQSLPQFYRYFRIFCNASKLCPSFSSAAVCAILSALRESLPPFFQNQNDLWLADTIKPKDLEEGMLDEFIGFYSQPEADLYSFLTTLCEKVSIQTQDTLKKKESEFYNKAMLGQLTVNFIQNMLGKLSWQPQEFRRSWSDFLAIAGILFQLARTGVIADRDALNDCFWSLNIRYSLFLENNQNQLPAYFLQELIQNLQAGEGDNIWEFPDPEDDIVGKKRFLLETLQRCLNLKGPVNNDLNPISIQDAFVKPVKKKRNLKALPA